MTRQYGLQAGLDAIQADGLQRRQDILALQERAPPWSPREIWPFAIVFAESESDPDRRLAAKLVALATDPRMEAVWARLAGHEERFAGLAFAAASFAVDGAGSHGLSPAQCDARRHRVIDAASELLRALRHAPHVAADAAPIWRILEQAVAMPSPDAVFGRRDRSNQRGKPRAQDLRAFSMAIGGMLIREFGVDRCAPTVVDLASVVLEAVPDLRVVQLALGKMRKK